MSDVAPEVPEENPGENSSAPEPQPHAESGPLPFYQRAANARQVAHEALEKVEKDVKAFYTSFRDRT